MLVWCTGISGSGRSDYVSQAAAQVQKSGRSCRVLEVGDFLDRVPEHLRVGPTATALLDGNENVLRLHRAYALNALLDEIKNQTSDVTIVSTNACFIRKGRTMPRL